MLPNSTIWKGRICHRKLCEQLEVGNVTKMVVLGDTYGAGNGSTTFNVPQLQGKTPQGYDGNTYNLAGTGGANTVTVAVTNNLSYVLA